MKIFIKMAATLLCTLLTTAPALAGDITISAAASLREVVTELSESFSAKNPAVTIKKNFGGSGVLAKQIENGAPADIFISANREWVDYLKARKLTDDKGGAVFAYNELVFVGKPELKVNSLGDLVKLGRIAIGSPRSVPAGEYAVAAFKKAGIDRHIEKKLVMGRDVRECLMYAEGNMVDGAFVYKTDAQQLARRARIHFTVPAGLYPRVTYPMALTRAGAKKPEAAAFYNFLQTSEAAAVLARHGFPVK